MRERSAPDSRQTPSEQALEEVSARLEDVDRELLNERLALSRANTRLQRDEDELQVKSRALADAFQRESELSERLESCERELRMLTEKFAGVRAELQAKAQRLDATEQQFRFNTHKALRREHSPGRRFLRSVWWIVTMQFGRIRRHENFLQQKQLILESGLFDFGYYYATYPDVAAAGVDPLIHFIEYGAGEGRNPGPAFDTKFYLGQNPDVEKEGSNPLIHYLRYGKAEGRKPTAIRSPS